MTPCVEGRRHVRTFCLVFAEPACSLNTHVKKLLRREAGATTCCSTYGKAFNLHLSVHLSTSVRDLHRNFQIAKTSFIVCVQTLADKSWPPGSVGRNYQQR